MKIIRKGMTLLFKSTLLALLVTVLFPPLYFAWRAAEPLPQAEFKGLSYYQFTQWRKMKHEESIAKYEASHPNVEYTGVGNRMTACYQNEIVIERTFLPFQAFTYTLAALNLHRNGRRVIGYDPSPKAPKDFPITVAASATELVSALETPRIILLMVPAGKAVTAAIDSLKPILQNGDIVIDGGNSFFVDTERSAKSLEADGILLIGMGVSGGESGALW
jgi:hypothetical protein